MTGGVLASAPVLANENASLLEAKEESEESQAESDFLSRSALTGDWWGVRSSLADTGITLDIRHTSFYQGQMAGTGDQTTQTPFTVQSIVNMLTEFGVTIPDGVTLQLKNVAAVTVHADLPAFSKPGQTIDVTVASIGNAIHPRIAGGASAVSSFCTWLFSGTQAP